QPGLAPSMDYQKPPESPGYVRVVKAVRHQEKFVAKKDHAGNSKKEIEWERLQCISSFEVPKGWNASRPGGQGIVSCSMHPSDSVYCFIKISYHSYGLVGGNAVERSLRKKLILEPTHELDDREGYALHNLLQNYRATSAQPKRSLEKCRTKDLNGKQVIIVESSDKRYKYWPHNPDSKTIAFLVDPTGEGMDYLSIEYTADVKVFDKYKDTAMKAIKSVEWKKLNNKLDEEYLKSVEITPP
ncbi:MAG: hypothetical protein K8F91_00110, partial [Candidatus Obscuribacterales bacterium]|nr:hypothetical protein [Candidatus Obscuribacterales bacterium]